MIGLPNPASKYCIDSGYELKIVAIPDGSGNQTGFCIMPDGTECEEWDFYNGLCGYPSESKNNTTTIYIIAGIFLILVILRRGKK